MNGNIENDKEVSILIIEDNLGDYFLFEEYINDTQINKTINHCENFEKAVDFLRNTDQKVSIIFSDLHLPDASDLDLIKKLLSHSSSIPVILLSGHINEYIIQESKNLGAFDFFLKDNLSPALLEESISKAILNKN